MSKHIQCKVQETGAEVSLKAKYIAAAVQLDNKSGVEIFFTKKGRKKIQKLGLADRFTTDYVDFDIGGGEAKCPRSFTTKDFRLSL